MGYPLTLTVDDVVAEYKLDSEVSVNDAETYTVCALSGCGLIQVSRFRV